MLGGSCALNGIRWKANWQAEAMMAMMKGHSSDVFGMGTNALVRYNLRYFFNDIHVLNQKPIYPEVGILI